VKITAEEEAKFRAAVRSVCAKIAGGKGTIGWYWMGLEGPPGAPPPEMFTDLVHEDWDHIILIPQAWDKERTQVDAIGRDEVAKFANSEQAS